MMMYRFCFALIMGLMVSFGGYAQSQIDNMLRDAKKFNMAYMAKDYQAIADMTIPSVVELAGGKELMAKLIKQEMDTKENINFTLQSIEPLKPEKIDASGENLQAILPQLGIFKLGDRNVRRKVYYLANSSDLGKTWTFLDLEAYDEASIKQFVPSFTGKLKFPDPDVGEIID